MWQLFRIVSIVGIAFVLAGCGSAETPATVPPFDKSKLDSTPPPAKGAKAKAGFD